MAETSEQRRDGGKFRAHWSVLLPTVLIAALYFAMWLWMWAIGSPDGALARLALLVLTVGVPLLFVHAGLRMATTRMRAGEKAVIVRRGWPRRDVKGIRYRDIDLVECRRGLVGNLLDTGTVVITTDRNERYVISDIASPHEAVAAVNAGRARISEAGATAALA